MDEDIGLFALFGVVLVAGILLLCLIFESGSRKKVETADGTTVTATEKSTSESGTYEYVIISE